MASSSSNTDKENKRRRGTPLPDGHSALRKHLLKDQTTSKRDVLRPGPLRTINADNTGIPKGRPRKILKSALEPQGTSAAVVAKPEDKRTPDLWKGPCMQGLNSYYTTDVMKYLLDNEKKLLHKARTSCHDRAGVINWFMTVNGADGNPDIVQTACWYFDAIVGYILEHKPLLLVGAACFWIAQKLKGVRRPVPAMKLVQYSNSAFTTDELVAAEREVMSRLGFPKLPIVPEDYIPYLSWWCDPCNAREIEVAASFLVMCGQLANRDLCVEYPSVIAVAAVKNALLLLKKKDLLQRLQTSNMYLLSSSTARRSVTDLMPMIGARFYTQVEALERRADVFEEQLAREMDNGRLLRILIKLGVVNERPELNLDASWSETGDRYMLKLFRDYLFHSVSNDGRPWLDQAHLAHCLNQLDGGTAAKVELMSRDEQSVLVVSYAELKHCLEQAFDEVMQAAAAGP